jgi:glyoxalase family protein
LDHLRARGIEVTDILDRSYFRSLYFRAPDGVLLEIATDGPGFAIDEEEDALGRALRLPPWLERRRPEVEAALAPLPLPAGAPAGTSAADGDPAADDRPGREERTR